MSKNHISNIKDTAAISLFPLAGLIIFILSQLPTLAYCWQNWNESESYYSHGPIVPILAGIMIWNSKNRLSKVKLRSSWSGLPLLLLGSAVQFAGISMSWEPLYGLSFLLSLFGMVMCLLGPQTARLMAIPLIFLATMLPLPANLLDAVTGRFQIVSTTIASAALRFADSSLTQNGNIINADSLATPLMVDRPCSGLKMLIALITSTWFLAWILETPPWKKIVLLSLALPLSIIVNSLRVIMIGLVGIQTSSSEAVKSFHDFSGLLGLGLGCALVLVSARWLKMYGSQALPPGNATFAPSVSRGIPGHCAIIWLCISAAGGTTLQNLYEMPNGHLARDTIPSKLTSWTSSEEPISADIKKQLAKGDSLSRTFTDADKNEVNLFVTASLDYSAFHSPQICLPGSGIEITGQRIIRIKDPITAQPINATQLEINRDGIPGSMVYWYSLGGATFPSTSELYSYTRKSRLKDLKQMTVNPASLDKLKADINSRQAIFYRFTMEAAEAGALEKFINNFLRQMPRRST